MKKKKKTNNEEELYALSLSFHSMVSGILVCKKYFWREEFIKEFIIKMVCMCLKHLHVL